MSTPYGCMGVGADAGVGVNRQTDFQRHLGFKDNPAVALRKRVLEYSPGGGAYPKPRPLLLLRSPTTTGYQ